MVAAYSGIWPVAPTAFHEDGTVDFDGMKRVLDCIIDQGADGICILANFSEQFLLSDQEREQLGRECLEHIAGRVPVIVTISHFATQIAVERARFAKDLGADAVMMMPPYHGALLKGTPEQTFEQFAEVGKVGIPIMVQDAPLSGVDLPVPLLVRMAKEIEMVKLFKIECPRAANKIRALIDQGGDAIEAPFDGEEAITLLADLDAGCTGSMTSGMIVDQIKPVITHHLAGHFDQATAAYGRVAMAINHENRQCGWQSCKAAMVEGGVIKSDFCRHPIPALHPDTKKRLIDLLRPLDPLVLRWGKSDAPSLRYQERPKSLKQPSQTSAQPTSQQETHMTTYTPHGKSLIAGDRIASIQTFKSSPASGEAQEFFAASPSLVGLAVEAAEEAFWTYGYTSRDERAAFLNKVADEIEARAEAITAIAMSETGLPEARLQGERGRTTSQLRLFASHIAAGDYLDRRHDEALPDRAPLPRPDLKMVQRPIGPVAVFGASNFPLAFSTGGGDTAAALAAGCPVVFKGHPAHPGTGEIIAEAFAAAIKACGLPAGTFSFLQSNSNDVGSTLVQHPLIKAVGFTGSLGGGRALFDLCAARPEPIPFFGELGSINPMFLLSAAAETRGADLGTAWAGSLTMGAGQFCTNPGIVIAIEGQETAFVEAARTALADAPAQTMLTDGIAAAYVAGKAQIGSMDGVEAVVSTQSEGRTASPNVFKTSAANWLKQPELAEEVFGPLGLVVVAKDLAEMLTVAKAMQGQLTCSILMDGADTDQARQLMPILERKAGRVLANGFPTGVEVADAMVHGGPYPASTNFGATSVGMLAIRRFLRPVCYQNIPAGLVPEF